MPVSGAGFTARDGKLVERFRETLESTSDTLDAPAISDVAVVRRFPQLGTGDVVWMPDPNTYCHMKIRASWAQQACHALAKWRMPQGYVHVGFLSTYNRDDSAVTPEIVLYGAIVENVSGPFAFAGGALEDAPPLQEAAMRFPSGSVFTFLTYGPPENMISSVPEICGAGRTVCFKAFELGDTGGFVTGESLLPS
ncbi:hypothetical protein SRB5_59760 [Streptomyces sp. RB5]|uniref:Uncharacterized protein n=1 Tax=Streptomyces smaragdinus TaxID=2585196 RepID=A0A7K0CQM2_9ACTN|nr:hypothetical protein [Streptomyces smaragdinus]MQY15785.1 hypothetical protein [Streptomyces smaragdinus]